MREQCCRVIIRYQNSNGQSSGLSEAGAEKLESFLHSATNPNDICLRAPLTGLTNDGNL